jgi:septum formation protein
LNTTNPYFRQLAQRYKIVLGSGSPRRVKLLTETGIPFRQSIPDLHEAQLPGEEPFDYAMRLARDKALKVASTAAPDELVIGCDTIVVLDGVVLEKPLDKSDAHRILATLSGKQHVVCTSLAMAYRSEPLASDREYTKVYFNEVTGSQIDEYIETGEPMDKAGAYGIQGMGAFLVDSIEGNLDNVIGFPRTLLDLLSKEILDRQP